MLFLHFIHTLIIASVSFVSSISIGRVGRARIIPGSGNQIVWFLNQANANICLCTALQNYQLVQIAAVNSFPSNFSCQLILSPPILSPRIVADNRSMLLLLQTLSDAPCCSDLTWLLERIKAAPQQSRTVLTEPTTLSINSAKTIISTMIYRDSYVRIHRNNMSIQGIYSMPSGYVCATIISYKGLLFFGCDTPGALVIFNESNLASPITIMNMYRYVRGVSFARNDSLMFVAVQRGNWSLYVYNVSWGINNISTSLVQMFIATGIQTWTTFTVNDSFVLLTSWDSNTPVYAVKSVSTTSNTWSMISLNKTKVRLTEFLGEAVVDPCGRLWMIVYKFGIRIYDASATILLANWTLSTGLSNILFLENWEVLISDYDQGYIYRFNPGIRCTS